KAGEWVAPEVAVDVDELAAQLASEKKAKRAVRPEPKAPATEAEVLLEELTHEVEAATAPVIEEPDYPEITRARAALTELANARPAEEVIAALEETPEITFVVREFIDTHDSWVVNTD